jgi:hypothetical protein
MVTLLIGVLTLAAEPSSSRPRSEAIRERLVALMDQDQRERKTGSPVHDKERALELRVIIEEFGWPSVSMVGEKASTAAWIIAQHADHDVAFQRYCLSHLQKALERRDANPGDWAYLVDRIRVNEGRAQIYGTQFGRPLEDETNVDARRAEVGLERLADYLARRPK